jgi:methylase of polypeptide subunit release factors
MYNGVLQGDLLSSLRVFGGVDVLVYNPPYVPTSEDDVWAGDLRFSWRGGGMGMDTTWLVLDELEVCFLLNVDDGRIFWLLGGSFI